jgi:putative hemolysin
MSAITTIQGYLFRVSTLVLTVTASMPGCVSGAEGSPPETSGSDGDLAEAPSAIANPASVYCADLGYRLDIRSSEAGEYGVCLFPDGSSCEEWDFYRGKCGQRFSYCRIHGFRISSRTETGSASFEYAVCTFPDGSECNEGEYSEGECRPSQCRRWSVAHGCVR